MARRPIDINSIDLSQYELANKQQSQSSQQQPDSLNSLARGVGRTVARGVESIVGLPGDIASGVLGVGNYLTGGRTPTYEDIQSKVPGSFPTSQQVRQQGTERLTGEALKPQSRNEELYDEFIGDLATLALPVKGKIPFKAAATRALGANFAGYLTEQVAGEGAGKGAKMLYYLGSNLPGGRKALQQTEKTAYDAATEAIKDTAKNKPIKYNYIPLRNELSPIEKWTKTGLGLAAPEKKLVNDILQPIKKHGLNTKGHPSKIAVNELWQVKKDINTLLNDPRNLPKGAEGRLREISGITKGYLRRYGQEHNLEFLKHFDQAEDIHKGLHQASFVNQFLQDNFDIDKLLTNGIAKGLFAGTVSKFIGLPKTVATGLAGIGAKFAVRSAEFIYNSPEARKYYFNVLKAAAKENKAAIVHNLAKLNEVAEDYERKNPSQRTPIDINSIDLSQYELA